MSDYNKTTNFTAKDSLTTSDPEKVILGADMDTEFDNIETANGTKLDKTGGTLTGTLTTSALISTTEAINESKGSDIASATTTDIGAASGNLVDITGTTTITGFGTVQAGTQRTLQFDGSLTITYNATSMILPGNEDIITQAGDTADVISLGSGNWLMTNYQVDSDIPYLTKPSFSVHRNGVDQADITGTDKIEWTTEEFDTNSDFDVVTNYRFTPTVAGKYLLSASLKWLYTSLADNDGLFIALYKNGVSHKEKSVCVSSGWYVSTDITATVDANGTSDYFEIFAYNNDRNTSDIEGNADDSYFTGCKID